MTEKAWIIDTEPSKRFPVFTRLNAADVMPEPITPLGASMCWKPMVLPGWASGYVQDACFTADEMVEESAVAGFLYGYLYINQSSVRVLGIRKGMTWELIDQMFFNSPGAPVHAASEADANEALSAAAPARSGWVLTTTNFPEVEEDEILADRIRNERPNLKGLSNRALIARARSVMPYERLAWRSEQMGSSNAALGPAVAGMMLGDKAHLLVSILGQAGEVESAAPTYALWALSRTLRADAKTSALFDQGLAAVAAAYPSAHGQFWSEFGAFISEFGFRGPSEWDLGTDSWESKPSLALALVDRMRQLGDEDSPHAKQAAHAGATDRAMAEATAGMDAATEGAFRGAIASARRFAGWRESGKSSCTKIMNEARIALLELGFRLEADGVLDHARQIFIALDEELDALALGGTPTLKAAIREREAAWKELWNLEVPMFIDTSKGIPPISSLPRKGNALVERASVGTILTGAAASQGIVEGKVRVVLGTDNISDFQPGEILVAPQTDPSWTPLFMVASGVIVNTGSMGSHAMIVARELGIPCVGGIPGATNILKTGDTVRVNGATGVVEVLAV